MRRQLTDACSPDNEREGFNGREKLVAGGIAVSRTLETAFKLPDKVVFTFTIKISVRKNVV